MAVMPVACVATQFSGNVWPGESTGDGVLIRGGAFLRFLAYDRPNLGNHLRRDFFQTMLRLSVCGHLLQQFLFGLGLDDAITIKANVSTMND